MSYDKNKLQAEMAKASAQQKEKSKNKKDPKKLWKEQRKKKKHQQKLGAVVVIWCLALVATIIGLYLMGYIRFTPNALTQALKNPKTTELNLAARDLDEIPPKSVPSKPWPSSTWPATVSRNFPTKSPNCRNSGS